jgi:hypothetical protein
LIFSYIDSIFYIGLKTGGKKMETKETIIKHNNIQNITWIEEPGFVGSTITYINEDELNHLIENGEVRRINGVSDVGVNGDKRVNPIEEYVMVEKENPDSPYTKVQIDIDYNAKMLYYEGDEIVYSEILEWPEFCTLENCDETSRIYIMRKEWISALFETSHFLKAKKAHLEFLRDSLHNTINNLLYDQKVFSQRFKEAKKDLEQIEKELKDLPFCRICGGIMKYEQEIPMKRYPDDIALTREIMYSWTCPECKNSEMRDYKEVK